VVGGHGRQLHQCLCVLFVHALKGKRLELSTPNLVDIQCMTVAQYALTRGQKVKIQGHMVIGGTAGMNMHASRQYAYKCHIYAVCQLVHSLDFGLCTLYIWYREQESTSEGQYVENIQ